MINTNTDDFKEEVDSVEEVQSEENISEESGSDSNSESEFGEIELKCPSCSPQDETWHQIIKSGQSPVARCMDCGQINSYRISRPKKKTLKIIVSQMENTTVFQTTFNEEERFFVDDEIIVDDDISGTAYPIVITSLGMKEQKRPAAFAKDLDTIWGRAIDEVTVKIAIQDKDITKSFDQKVPGDFSYIVGQNVKIDGKTYPIVSIKIRGGGFRSKAGETVLAKKIKRVYAKKPHRMYDSGKRENR
ncbi:HVO_0476 family zinc finger protein [Methanolapillus ohkumae]|uniref:Uncharacterized protein n=1 Tax=Methanolapillus ohkumae TaxID=3028298 RepID=A0AA96V7U4_9EURY|nr:hypothetical protein MsAm2_12280 [Methanosarcinaceae archaeon Am2]